MSRRTVEWLKTGLIVLLLVSAVLLGYSSDVFTGLSGAFSPSQATSSETGSMDRALAEAARPIMLVLTNEASERAVFKYDMDTLDLIYERTSSSLGEALGSLSAPEECTETEWRQALQSPGIMFEYHTAMPLELVRDWLGASGEGYGISPRRICLVFDNNATALYLESNGKFYVSQTASLGGETSVSTTYDGSLKYQFEQDDSSVSPYTILSTAGSSHATAIITNPLSDGSALPAAVSVLGVDLRLTSSYPESDGTRVYISNTFYLSVSPDGVVDYHRDVEPTAMPAELRDAVELARRTVAATIGAFSGDARVHFTGCSAIGGAVTVTFDYFFAGGRVIFPGQKSAAEITVTGNSVTALTLYFRSFDTSDSMVLLPEAQALAISNGEFALGYADSATAFPFWYRYDAMSSGGGA